MFHLLICHRLLSLENDSMIGLDSMENRKNVLESISIILKTFTTNIFI